MSENPGLDVRRASTARMYNFYLGGKAWYAADEEAARKVIRAAPSVRAVARENFLFADRAAAWAAAEFGIRQCLDIGVGIVDDVPLPSVEHCVRQAVPGARVVAFDHDEVVLAHARGLRPGYGGVLYGDVAEPGGILDHPELDGLVDLDAPVLVVLAAVLHFVPNAHQVMAELRRRLAPGSAVVLSHVAAGRATGARSRVSGVTRAYGGASSRIVFRDESEVRGLVDGWVIVDPPGVCDIQRWAAGGPLLDGPDFDDVGGLGLVALFPDADGAGGADVVPAS